METQTEPTPHPLKKWTNAYCKEILDWQKQNPSNYRQVAEHFGEKYEPLAQALSKYKSGTLPKRAYNKKPVLKDKPQQMETAPKVKQEILTLDLPVENELTSVAIAIVPLKQLKQFLVQTWL